MTPAHLHVPQRIRTDEQAGGEPVEFPLIRDKPQKARPAFMAAVMADGPDRRVGVTRKPTPPTLGIPARACKTMGL